MNLNAHCWSLLTTPGNNILKAVNIVHECTNTCVLAEKASIRAEEREHLRCNQLTFVHDWSNFLYFYNVFCV